MVPVSIPDGELVRTWCAYGLGGNDMNIRVNDKRTFYMDDGSQYEKNYQEGTPILCTSSHRFAQQVSQFLSNEFGWHTFISTIKDDNPYVLVMTNGKHGKPSKVNLKTARLVAKAIAVGIDIHYALSV